MTRFKNWGWTCTLLVLYAATAITASAQVFSNLASFEETDGRAPEAALVQGLDGNFYSTASQGGGNENGTVFRITPRGNLTAIYNFCESPNCRDAAYPIAGLVLTTDGDFLGTTNIGGANDHGTVYKISPTGAFTTLHSFTFTDGASPQAPLIQAIDGSFYGTTIIGGRYVHRCNVNAGCGTVFKITPAGALTTGSFNGDDGADPEAPLTQAANGTFYGTTAESGNLNCTPPYGCGIIFKISPLGKLTTLYSFCSQSGCADGEVPVGNLVQGTDGNLYGPTAGGGSDLSDCIGGCGTVFKITPEGTLTTVHSFTLTDGASPIAGLILATDGNFYGTTAGGGDLTCNAFSPGCGTVFQLTPAGTFTTLHNLELTEGAGPRATLFQATNGNFYGAAVQGGDISCNVPFGCGSIFAFSMGLGPFVAFVRDSGKVGQTGPILGQGFTGTTSVSINGIQASFTVISDTFIRATVPPGATSGYVQVVTPSGTLTSNVPFRVIP